MKLIQQLADRGFNESETTITNDLKGLTRIGLNIQEEQGGYFLQDTIKNLEIPGLASENTVKSDIQELVDRCRDLLEHVPHDYLILIPMRECGFDGLHLGGANQPDGLIFTQKLRVNYGVIIDTKAYEAGFNIPASERDKMTRYVNENILRNG